jgi:transcriptional regulator with XRE-family HTH domain
MNSEEHPLRLARRERGWSVYDLANKAYVTARTIMRAEQGQRLNPETIQRLQLPRTQRA